MQNGSLNELEQVRRYYAEELKLGYNLQTEALVEAFASVPRECFLGAGPWWIRGAEPHIEGPLSWETPDDNPRNVYHNVSVAIDLARNLFNGQPGLLATWIDKLQLVAGQHVLHVGCGTGYYSALMAKIVGPSGRVLSVEIDPRLATRARESLSSFKWVEVRQANGAQDFAETFDSVLINAGATHPLPCWLNALRPTGRLIVPLTIAFEQMPGGIGKGVTLLISRREEGYDASFLNIVAIYSCEGARDPEMGKKLVEALRRPFSQTLRQLRRDPHEPAATCWFHGDNFCLTT